MKVEIKNQNMISVPTKLSPGSVADFEKRLAGLLSVKPDSILLDCRRLEQVTSVHVSALVLAYQKCEDADTKIRLVSPSQGLVQVLRVLDLYELFSVDNCDEFEQPLIVAGKYHSDIYADEFLADSKSIDAALNNFMHFLESYNLPHILTFELRTIFYEIAYNIKNHAQIGPEESVVFTAKTCEDKIDIVFADSGIPFDLTGKGTDLDARVLAQNKQIRGYGLTLIKKMTDKISYVRENDSINILIIEKKWR